jgi:copper chaperone CopZ
MSASASADASVREHAASALSSSTILSFLTQAMLASSCCLLQLFLNIFSLGCAGLMTLLQPYRIVFLGMLLASMAFSIYREQRKSSSHRQWRRLVSLCILSTLIAASPDILQRYNDTLRTTSDDVGAPLPTTPITGARELTLAIGGMHCEACRHAVQSALKTVPGVESVFAQLENGRTHVEYRPTAETPDVVELQAHLIRAVEEAGFTATIGKAGASAGQGSSQRVEL